MIQTGDPSPDFTLPALDGLEYALHEATGKGPVVLAFWQKDCGACKLAASYFNRLYDAYENLGWSFWSISQNEAAGAAEFVRRYDFRPTVLVDGPGLAVSALYDPPSTPTLYVVEPDRVVSLVADGFDKEALNDTSGASPPMPAASTSRSRRTAMATRGSSPAEGRYTGRRSPPAA